MYDIRIMAKNIAMHWYNGVSLQVRLLTLQFAGNSLINTYFTQEPVWLNMMTQSSQRTKLCETFKDQLTDCLSVCNNRETNL